MKKLLVLILTIYTTQINAQIFTKEDSLNAGLVSKSNPTVLSGYGEAKYMYKKESKTANVDVTRAILFLGHRFSNKVQFFSEWELEHTKVATGFSGEFALEQFLLKYNLNKDIYLVSGLFTPRIGIINENHLPTTFNGNDRPYLERTLIPATWRELGVCLYGNSNRIPGLNYSIAITNGLDASKFNSAGIRSARPSGSEASSRNIAATAALLYYRNNFRFQASSYYGGTNGLSDKDASTNNLSAGPFAIPVNLNEINVQYKKNGFSAKALAAIITIKEAEKINDAYSSNFIAKKSNVPNEMLGGYIELGYDILNKKFNGEKAFIFFCRYEEINLNSKYPSNGIQSKSNNQTHLVSGITFVPTRGVSFKLDHHFEHTIDSDFDKNYINIGFGYSF